MQNHTAIGVDLAKAVFEIAISRRPGHVCRRARLPRAKVREFFAQQPAATVVMEACGSAHYWGREFRKLGHRVVLLPPHQRAVAGHLGVTRRRFHRARPRVAPE